MIEYSTSNNLIITNTFYEHKDKYTRVVANRNEKSIIDYILVEKSNRTAIEDVRIMKGAEIDSDHFLLVGKIKQPNKNGNEGKHDYITEQPETLKAYILQEQEVAEKYEEAINKEIQK
ncbi:hypothetical protein Zmor_004573 [Zophobas morio]|uniref:Uncharacterized protein n=1 Tax=Zophobas morio TaxID=2755281 RepID=A0AA38ILF8_9CUCU|nr:hypothetical protein Zmor_004573 [Zophobas morio]